jgi:mono/diheme cytochrome c family protein/cytochrome bd-type quinol oxidase subunit 1
MEGASVKYPFWDISMGYGVLMAVISVLHVFVSHFAIGGGLYLVVTERAARKAGDALRLAYLQKVSKMFILVTLVFGALSGVGIWFVIGLLNPTATELLIHNFVWGWAIEWTFFVVEIASALLYYYGWNRMSDRDHMTLGWIYFVSAWLSLVVINGILAFMLTPGAWIQTGNFWDGFFNATYWPSLFLRTGVCIMLAGLYTLLVASREQGNHRSSLIRYNANWVIAGLVVMAPTLYWYWHSIPAEVIEKASDVMKSPIKVLFGSFWLAGLMLLLAVVFGYLTPRALRVWSASLLMLFGLVWFGHFEYFREAIRKPWIVTGFMYANAVEVSNVAKYQTDGMLPSIQYRTLDIATDLFDHACRTCHTVSGYRAIAPALAGSDSAYIAALVKNPQLLKGNMPPFAGTETEAGMIATHIYAQTDHRTLREITGLTGAALGEKVYLSRCGICHVPGSSHDKLKSLAGLKAGDYGDMLDQADVMGEGMPRFTASQEDRDALIAYLVTLTNGVTDAKPGL